MGIGFILARSIFALEGAGAKHLMEIKGSKLGYNCHLQCPIDYMGVA